jgi:hypothetical protein
MLYRDYGTLRWSMRSVVTYAPWIRYITQLSILFIIPIIYNYRRIILVTNGQLPSWLNTSHPRIRLVTHEGILLYEIVLVALYSFDITHSAF